MNIKKIKISDIKIENRLWDIDENTVTALVESIGVIGLKSLPTVRVNNANEYILVAGNHRIEACKKLGKEDIEVIIDEIDENYALIYEIDENLTRRAIHYAERGYQLNERKKAYERIFGAKLSAQASFKRYFEDVKAIVEKGKKTSRYDYTLFNDDDFNFDYIKDRVDKNQMEDLFGVYSDKNGNEMVKKLAKQDIAIAERLYPILKAIDGNTEYVCKFKDNVQNKLKLSSSTIEKDLLLGKSLTVDDIDIIKQANIDKHLVLKIIKDNNKDGYVNLIKENVLNTDSKKSANVFLKKAISQATKDVVDELGVKDANYIFKKTSEIVNKVTQANVENGLDKFDTNNLLKHTQSNSIMGTEMSSFNIDDKITKIAEIFNIDKTKLNSSIKKDKLQIIIDLKEIK